MSCDCKRKPVTAYEWTDGTNTIIYTSLMAAKAKVIRKGGSYKPVSAEVTK